MKPCSQNRKLIAALVLGGLETESATALRRHLESCVDCRRYRDELTRLTATLKAAEPDATIQATTAFHPRIVVKLKAEECPHALRIIKELLRTLLLDRRVTLPVTAGIAVALGVLLIPRQQPEVVFPIPRGPSATASPNPNANLEPTIANYQMLANQSLEKFDALLTEQGKRNLPPAPVYTASTLAIASKTD